jgi:hypothetical protein
LNIETIDNLPSRPFKGLDWSVHADVSRLIDEIFDEYEVWYRGTGTGKRIRDPGKIKQHLIHFVLEAYRTYKALPELCMGVHLSNRYYNNLGTRYDPNHLAYRIVVKTKEFLVAAGHLEILSIGKRHPDPRLSRTTRIRATSRLMDLCDEHGINLCMIVPYESPEVIILRAKKVHGQSGEPIDYKDTPFARRARKSLERINKYIAGHHINLDITDDQERELLHQLRRRDDPAKDTYVDFTKTRMRRIFNNGSFEEGGRFYGAWWQQIPGDYRVHITINSKRIAQLDYSGMHFAIMYADMGIDIPMDDPYALAGYGGHLRGEIKTAFNVIVNCTNRKQAIGTIDTRIGNGELSGELGGGERLLQAFAETHPLIEHKIASGEGVRAQFTDSRIAEKILLKGIDIDLCILPIHDGFITTAGDEFVLETLMNRAFQEVTGHNAKIKPETFDLSVLPDAGKNTPYWVTRSDGSVERDGMLEGKSTSFSQIVTKTALWGRLEKSAENKTNKTKRDKEWKLVHGQ